jgi:Leucine-rich repeat (LRR) protein
MNISWNALTLIPTENIKDLDNLEVFDCSNNKLTALPTTLTKLKKLRVLNANNNQFEILFDREF